jgi:DUF2075 family protein
MHIPRVSYGWAGSVGQFLETPQSVWLSSLDAHHKGLYAQAPSESQFAAWEDEYVVASTALRGICVAQTEAVKWSVAFEYELPLEGGRRPDMVLLAGDHVLVLEFKQSGTVESSALDQVDAYARDLSEYHKESHGATVEPILVCTRATSLTAKTHVAVTDPSGLAAIVIAKAGTGQRDLQIWLDSPYEPLPFLVDAARMIFQNEPLPVIRRAMSSGIPEAIAALEKVVDDGERDGGMHLGLVSGVPGSGKTLTGLSLVHSTSKGARLSTFLSGNGPLVAVLQDALGSKVFVRDLHKYVKQYGLTNKVPGEHVVVFDEAQRMWDKTMVNEKHGIPKSEPDLLISIAERLERWAVFVGLIGEGQEIHAGEEGGISLWSTAIAAGDKQWSVTCSRRLAATFSHVNVTVNDALDLTKSLRSRQAEFLHDWVAALLEGDVSRATNAAKEVLSHAFPMYVTRDLAAAKEYVVDRYAETPTARYGILASSKSSRVLAPYGIDSSFPATQRVKIAPWYNQGRGHPESGCALTSVVTEFGCQGLELDFPIVAWADDYLWDGKHWKTKPSRSKYAIEDPFRLRKNVYRVLLTRGRDGVVVFVPPDSKLDATYHILLASGLIQL